MQLADLETILPPEDLVAGQHLCCLSCRRRLAGLSLTDRCGEDGTTEVTMSVSLLSDGLRDFQQTHESLRLTCACGVRSTFHLV